MSCGRTGDHFIAIDYPRHSTASEFFTDDETLSDQKWGYSGAIRPLADAILDRLAHNAHRLALKGESLRKAAAKHHKLDAEPTN